MLLPVVPYMGVEVVSPDGFRVHRIVLQRTGYLLFYEVQEQSRVVKLLRPWDPRRGDVESFFFEQCTGCLNNLVDAKATSSKAALRSAKPRGAEVPATSRTSRHAV